jgi:hypothetical protein
LRCPPFLDVPGKCGAGLPRRVRVGRGRGGGNGRGQRVVRGLVRAVRPVENHRGDAEGEGGGRAGTGSRDGRRGRSSVVLDRFCLASARRARRGGCALLRGRVGNAASSSRDAYPLARLPGCGPLRPHRRGGPFSQVRASLKQRRMPTRAFRSPTRCHRLCHGPCLRRMRGVHRE